MKAKKTIHPEMQSDEEEDLPIDVKEEEDYFSATEDRPKPPTKGGDEVLEAAPPSPDPQHALLRSHCELPSGEVGLRYVSTSAKFRCVCLLLLIADFLLL